MGEVKPINEIISSTKYMEKEELLADETYFVIDQLDELEIHRYKIALRDRAKQLGCVQDVNGLFKIYLKNMQEFRKEAAKNNKIQNTAIKIFRDDNGKPLQMTENFIAVINNDETVCG